MSPAGLNEPLFKAVAGGKREQFCPLETSAGRAGSWRREAPSMPATERRPWGSAHALRACRVVINARGESYCGAC